METNNALLNQVINVRALQLSHRFIGMPYNLLRRQFERALERRAVHLPSSEVARFSTALKAARYEVSRSDSQVRQVSEDVPFVRSSANLLRSIAVRH